MTRRGAIAGVVFGVPGALFAAAAIESCSSSSSAQVGLDQGCSINSDCDQPLICAFGKCHSACAESRDCSPAGERCVISSAGKVCELPEESTCSTTATCATGLVCASDQQCRTPCQTAAQCALGQSCVTSGPAAACYDPKELDGSVVGGGMTDGSTGGDAITGTMSGGDSSSDGGGGGSPGGGDASCVGILPDGGCYYCPANACTGGTCANGNHDYSCQCFGGYSGTGTKACTLTNSCAADDHCPAGYPCEPTAAPGQACVGEYASWPMPDGATGAKVAPMYSDNQDGTISDDVTGLLWQAKLASPSNGCAATDAGPSCTQAQAQAYCGGLQLGGHGGWRLPTKIELESLLDCTNDTPPTIANAFNNNTYVTAGSSNAAYFWTSSMYEGNGSYWLVNFSNCTNYAGNPAAEADISARCVYGTGITPNTAATQYTIHSAAIDAGLGDAGTGDTVSDNRTGLTWERDFAPGMSEPAGAAYCAQLGAGFRLPTSKELLTLADPTRFSPSIDQTTFPGTPNDWFWASTLVQPPNGSGFIVLFTNGQTEAYGTTATFNVRCVK